MCFLLNDFYQYTLCAYNEVASDLRFLLIASFCSSAFRILCHFILDASYELFIFELRTNAFS